MSFNNKLLTNKEKELAVVEALEKFVAKLEKKYGVFVAYNVDGVDTPIKKNK